MDKITQHSLESTSKTTLQNWYYLMALGRKLDERAPNYLKQALGWSYHAPYAGHDGIQLAIGQVFDRATDFLFPYYRDMLTAISAGITAEEIILNGISKAADVASGGRHMSNHFAKPEWNIQNVSSCTGNHTLHAVGVARAIKYYGTGGVAISSQGESSTSEGYVYEAINGASNEKLPVIFVFQDNRYGISVPQRDQSANAFAADNFRGFKNLRIIHCDGKNVFASVNAMLMAKRHAIEKQEPVIVHASVVRIHSHSNSDRHELYRDENERHCATKSDPLDRFRIMLLHANIFTDDELKAIDEQAAKEVIAAHRKALASADPLPESIHNYVFPPDYQITDADSAISGPTQKLKLIQALNETLKAEFRHNPDTFIWGQDVANKDKGGIFNVTKGLQQEFGPKRVFNAPIAEDFILGTANGMSRFGKKLRIVVEGAEFADYFWPAMEQYIELSHDYWRSNGAFTPNVTIRLASGGYIGGGLYHSQNIEGSLCSIPGVRIVYPCYADDAAGLLRMSMRSEGPTVFLEPKALYNDPIAEAEVPEGHLVPFGKARIRKQGNHLTVVTYGNTTPMCVAAATQLEVSGNKTIEVIDARSLVPFDMQTVISSISKTGRVLVVHEDKVHGGFGGEIAARIAEEAFDLLDAPVKRVGSTFTPVGFNRILEKAVLPNEDKIRLAMEEILAF